MTEPDRTLLASEHKRGVFSGDTPLERPHLPALDGVRGLAILFVMVFHLSMVPPIGGAAAAWGRVSQCGSAGVDVFFALSGFLITGILLDSKNKPHYLRNFYGRRVLRIFPLYYAVVAFSFCILPRIAPWTVVKFGPVNRDAVWYWFHLSNFSIARRGAFVHGIMDVSWSLAIEEQFYLLWPAIVLVTSPRGLQLTCLVLISVSCISRVVLTALGVNAVSVYVLTFCRLDGLALGALVALAIRQLSAEALRVWNRRVRVIFGALVLCFVIPIGHALAVIREAATGHLIVSLFSVCSIFAIVTDSKSALQRIFRFSPLRILGRYSYALYLFHYPIAAALRDELLWRIRLPLLFGSSLPLQLVFYCVAGSVALSVAFISWHAYENRFLRLKRFFN